MTEKKTKHVTMRVSETEFELFRELGRRLQRPHLEGRQYRPDPRDDRHPAGRHRDAVHHDPVGHSAEGGHRS